MNTNIAKRVRIVMTSLLLFLFVILLTATAKETHAATGFVNEGGNTYYYTENGQKYMGWLTLGGKKYYFFNGSGKMAQGWVTNGSGQKRYFYKGSGIMATGWVTNPDGEKRYFYTGSGIMATGWVTNGSGQKRYFDPETGFVCYGWKTLDGVKYYFYSNSGIMATGWVTNGSGQKRFFNPDTGALTFGWVTYNDGQKRYFYSGSGYMATGWVASGGKYRYFDPDTGYMQVGLKKVAGSTYYFETNGFRVVNKTMTINGKKYSFDANGVGTEVITHPVDPEITVNPGSTGILRPNDTYEIVGNNIRLQDQNGRSYLIRKEFLEHPGIADGTKTDLDVLAALCECEAGDQGFVGMEAVAMCILNRTIKPDKEFPSTLRRVIYQGGSFAQYSPVTDGSLIRRLNNELWYYKSTAYAAAQSALNKFYSHVQYGTPRQIEGFPKQDFDYMYFMMESSFWKQPLDFENVEYFNFVAPNGDGHVFFVDWV